MTYNRVMHTAGAISIMLVGVYLPMPWWGGFVLGFAGVGALYKLFPWNE